MRACPLAVRSGLSRRVVHVQTDGVCLAARVFRRTLRNLTTDVISIVFPGRSLLKPPLGPVGAAPLLPWQPPNLAIRVPSGWGRQPR